MHERTAHKDASVAVAAAVAVAVADADAAAALLWLLLLLLLSLWLLLLLLLLLLAFVSTRLILKPLFLYRLRTQGEGMGNRFGEMIWRKIW